MISEPVPFLANIILVAHADGVLSANELGQLEAIRKLCKLKKRDFSAAIKLVEGGNHRLTPIGSFADQVKNLEFIFKVALADSDLDPKESELIDKFSNTIGLTEAQLEKLRLYVVASIEKVGLLCPSCAHDNSADSRFCSNCGDDLQASTPHIDVDFKIPPTGIAIEFAQSTSASFSKALDLARATPDYKEGTRGKKSWYLAAYPSQEIVEAIPLAKALGGLRNRKLYISGEEKEWGDVFGFSWCAAQRESAYRPIEYCFGKDENRLNPWGCKQARMDWAEWAGWFCYGEWETFGLLGKRMRWRFDKQRIKHELATNLYRFRYCPYLNAEFSEAVINHFPEVVEPHNDDDWDFHERYEEVPGAIKLVTKDRIGSFSFTDESWSDGVCPKGYRVLAEILGKALQDLGTQSHLSGLLPSEIIE
jgi:uncharacterized tellurite resistance protein B-like protein